MLNPRTRSVLWTAGGVVISMLIVLVFFTPRSSTEWTHFLELFAALMVGALWGSWRR